MYDAYILRPTQEKFSFNFSLEQFRRFFIHLNYLQVIKKMYRIFIIILSPFFCSFAASDSFLHDFIFLNDTEQSNVSINCARDCDKLSNALQRRNVWALKVDDASGRKPTGFFYGNNYFLGSQLICETLNNPPEIYMKPSKFNAMDLKLLKVKAQIPVEYRMIYFEHRSKLQFAFNLDNQRYNTIHLGLCLPKSCSEEDLEILSKQLIAKSFTDQKDAYGEMKFKNSKRLVLRPEFMSDKLVQLAM